MAEAAVGCDFQRDVLDKVLPKIVFGAQDALTLIVDVDADIPAFAMTGLVSAEKTS